MKVFQRVLLVFAVVFPIYTSAKIELWRRVVYGLEADIADYPVLVVLQFLDHIETICTGVIIHPRWLISAAHCFHPDKAGLNPENGQVRAGSSFGASGGEIYRLDLTLYNHLYRPEYPFDDIGIAKTSEPFQLSPTIQMAVIAEEGDPRPSPGDMCTVVGYGQTRNPDWDRPEVERLRYKDIPILNNEVCEEHFAYDRNTQLCAGSPDKFMGSNYGDSGGPLFCNGVVVALVEGGPSKDDSGGPNIYTELTVFREDLQRVIDTM